MLNKIKIIGKIITKEQNERKFDDSAFQETMKGLDKSQFKPESEKENNREPYLYFSLLVPTPSGSLTILRCITQGEIAERIANEVQEEEVIEVHGYLRNEKSGRQIIIRAVDFHKLDLSFDAVDRENSNQVRLLGKIITDLQDPENKRNPEILSFKLAVPREGVKFPLFFCRVHGELMAEVNEKLKKGDIILLEGFLQTKKIEELTSGENEKKFSRISSIICRGFTFLDNDYASIFSPLDNLTRIFKDIGKIDFTKPKIKAPADGQIE